MPKQQKVPSSKPVDNFVSKLEARRISQELDHCPQDLSSLFTRLFTARNELIQALKTQAARDRVSTAITAVIEGAKYGWTFGLSGRTQRLTRLRVSHKSPRVRALVAMAIRRGEQIGWAQCERMRHSTPQPRHHKHG